jgi:hypothetical protein
MRSQSKKLQRFVLMAVIGLAMAFCLQPKPGPGCKGARVGSAHAGELR